MLQRVPTHRTSFVTVSKKVACELLFGNRSCCFRPANNVASRCQVHVFFFSSLQKRRGSLVVESSVRGAMHTRDNDYNEVYNASPCRCCVLRVLKVITLFRFLLFNAPALFVMFPSFILSFALNMLSKPYLFFFDLMLACARNSAEAS